ncbi:carbamoyltransferase [Lachnospiraceae bacterium]|nr:carbamoyltransferase [Lachnospiraceae bacterium]
MIIGIQIGETSGAAVYSKGKILYAASEERFSGKKNDSNFPKMAIQRAVELCDVRVNEIEKVVIATIHGDAVKQLTNVSSYSIGDWLKEQNQYWYPLIIEKKTDVDYLKVFDDKVEKTEYKKLLEDVLSGKDREAAFHDWVVREVRNIWDIDENKIVFINHELSHAAWGYYGSSYEDFEDVMAVVFDGWGDESNASIYEYKEGKIHQIKKYTNYNVGRIYRYITLLLGMKPLEHEYKVMGLAPYATEYIYAKPLEVFRKAYDFIDGEVVVDSDLKDHYFYFKNRLEGMRFDGIAAALQIFTEEMNKKLIKFWMEKTGKKKLVLSGGVSLNIKANMEIGKMDCVEDLFVPGSGGDESHCMGAIFAYLDNCGRGNEIEKIKSLYLGDSLGETDVASTLAKAKNNGYVLQKKLDAADVANYLSKGLVIGRISGRMEFGARALGNRSILADPRNNEIIERINKKIKNRDFWMPFTPSILDEDKDKYLNNPKQLSFPYMTIGCETTEVGKNAIKAAIHPADKTARPQIVTEAINKEYYDIIREFKKLTGVGVLLNTSLNLHGYPIVRTAKQAFHVFENSDLDGLLINDNLILRDS